MRRITRWTLNTVTVLSLLLCVAAVMLWVRSYSHYEGLGFQALRYRPGAEWINGKVAVRWRTDANPVRTAARRFAWTSIPTAKKPALRGFDMLNESSPHWRGFQHWVSEMSVEGDAVPVRTHFVIFPLWAMFLASAALPAAKSIRWIARRRLTWKGRCPVCRYDLTGNVSGVCPECGTSIARVD